MSIRVNDIFLETKSNERFRILFLRPAEDAIDMISLSKRYTLPYFMELSDVESKVKTGSMVKVADESTFVNPNAISNKLRERTDKNWSIIQDFVLDEPRCFESKARSLFIGKKSREIGGQRNDIQRLLCRYWAGGKNKFALIPNYTGNGGSRAKAKGVQSISEEPLFGRPATYSSPNLRMRISEETLSQIRTVINRYYNKSNKFNLIFCYDRFIEANYMIGEKLTERYPTKRQFYYHAKQFIKERERIGTKKYDRNNRGILGSSRTEAMCPGDTYQIDATIGDFYLVAQFDRSKVIGRPVIYLVADVFSRMLVGFYVGIEGPSWIGAMNALCNTAMDKVAICSKYGVKIEQSEWPCFGLPAKLMVDNGELISEASNKIIENLCVHIENASSWRPDQKGIIERYFHLLNTKIKALIPGGVYTDFAERGGHDYRKDAILTLNELTQIIVLFIQENNSRVMEKCPQLDDDIIQDQVQPIPIELWKWGVANRGLRVKNITMNQLLLSLMRHDTARVTEKGIKYKSIYYSCTKAIEENWFPKARKKSWQCEIAYDPRDTNRIYILSDKNNYEVCEKTAGYEDLFEDWNHEDLEQYEKDTSSRKPENRHFEKERNVQFNKRIQQIIENAKEESKIVPLSEVKSISGFAIRSNRNEEKAAIRQQEKFMLSEDAEDETTVARKIFFEEVDSNDKRTKRFADLQAKKMLKLQEDGNGKI